jgi:hypothetical protein
MPWADWPSGAQICYPVDTCECNRPDRGNTYEQAKWDELAANGPDLFPKEEPTWETPPPVLPDDKGRYDHEVALPGIYRPY